MSQSQDSSAIEDNSIRFGARLAASPSFKILFRDGMTLVEETAAYLDGVGRDEAKLLPRSGALAYASESMRLTTRLMQIASWLLLQRAVNEGEMTADEVLLDKRRTRVAWQQQAEVEDLRQTLPATLSLLIANSLHLQDRIARMDTLIDDPQSVAHEAAHPHPLELQMSRLRQAFGP